MSEQTASASNRDKRYAEAFRGLESPICDLRNAAGIASTILEDAMQQSDKQKSDYVTVLLHKQAVEELMFVVYEVQRRAHELRGRYYAAFKGGTGEGANA